MKAKDSRTVFERVTDEIYDRVEANNFNLELYGKSSPEFAVAKEQLNAFMDGLETCGYISYYYFDHGNDGMINDAMITMSMKTYKVMKGAFV